jgi:predicted nucleic acid-binding protein
VTRAAELSVPPDRVMLDTSVFLAATDESRTEHRDALSLLNRWPDADTALCVSGQVLREYLAVATRPATSNGLGLKPAEAAGNVRAIRQQTALLTEDARVTERLLRLLDDTGFAGRQVHDANIVATMLVHGVGTVVTMNTADFQRFTGYISVLSL